MEKALDLKFPTKPQNAAAFWEVLLDTLYKRNKDGWFVRVMLPQKLPGNPNKPDPQADLKLNKKKQPPLTVHNVNRESWDFGFLLKLQTEPELVKKVAKLFSSLPVNQKLDRKRLEKLYFEHLPTKSWSTDFEDIFYFFEWREALDINTDKFGMFESVRINKEQKLRALELLKNRLGEIVKLWPELLIYTRPDGKNRKS
jgi:hypothetical protein